MPALMDGKVIPTRKLPDQLAILPRAIAIGLGATQNNSDPMKYGIGPKKRKSDSKYIISYWILI